MRPVEQSSPVLDAILRRWCSAPGCAGTLRSSDASLARAPAGNRPLRGRSTCARPSEGNPLPPPAASKQSLHYAPRFFKRYRPAQVSPSVHARSNRRRGGTDRLRSRYRCKLDRTAAAEARWPDICSSRRLPAIAHACVFDGLKKDGAVEDGFGTRNCAHRCVRLRGLRAVGQMRGGFEA